MTTILPATFTAMLRDAAERWPERPAVVFEDTTLTFRELDSTVDVWARALLASGIEPGERVAVLASNRPEWLLASFAVARVGGVVVALNTWHKLDELDATLRRSAAVALLATTGMQNVDFVPFLQAAPRSPRVRQVICLSPTAPEGTTALDAFLNAGAGVAHEALRDREAAVAGSDDLFILFTSGSTAEPKGVITQNDRTVSNNYWIGERQGLNEHDALWLAVPLFYGFAAANAIGAAWTHGVALVLEERFDADRALDTMERTGATVYYGLGNMTRALVNAQRERPRRLSLRKGLTGYSYEDKRVAIEDLGVSELCGIYGLTECHGLCAMTSATDAVETRLEIDGYALPGWELLVVDPETELPLPAGTVGHLLVRGPLSRGYLDQPEATAAVFRDDGYFRTGDLVSIDAEGRMNYHSRLKDLVKVGGISVSPREVESVVELHPAVRQVFAVGVPDEARGEAVAVVVELRDGESLTADELRRFTKERAAAYNTPTHVLFLGDDEIPKLASGKASLRELREHVVHAIGVQR
ncbi:AMP-binding protein [Herbiconiux sp. KACC 21604]|uniref:class I adenylate-forming enzyme family protein n=1 Tax=unclassified Herbiconiux TaxID=2618217 RepID=UPI001491E2AB|nr:AMP-binding protein [Herbiconiux sp. SALV-R1]QJU55148.1 AMP-binding protein [Herbiconiux sp. SALV-R1]WPO86303.1 AMP-binding protein [Herbiconiux sp. KACC 21604]